MIYIVGIDPSTAKLALVTTTGERLEGIQVFPMPGKDRENTRAARAYNRVFDYLKPLVEADHSVYVFLEAPIYWRGGKSTIPLAQMSGAVQAAVSNVGASSVLQEAI